ncbi:hypothetical protein F4Z99_10740 [Candidatus Poribacteria bacterium]|nr:hypothetical protein [Candidatus Poribacteria bacterium]MYA98655.1 hypothetical protein [Candidatus Poribacteria bacterium]
MKRYTILLVFLLILTACGDQAINLNQVITQEIITEATDIQNVEESTEADNLWLITEALEQKEELHGQIISIVGYAGLQGENYNQWFIQLWNEPVGNYDDMWKYGKHKEYESETEKWNVCWTNCWKKGQDYASIRYASSYRRYRAPELTAPELRPLSVLVNGNQDAPYYGDPDPNLTFDSNLQEEPNIKLKSLDKYVLKVLVRDWGPGAGLTLIEIVEHTEMPAEQPPESINADNPMSVKEFNEQWENFYDQTVSVEGWVSRFSDNSFLSFGFWDDLNDPNSDNITVLIPYNNLPNLWKIAYHQGLERGGKFVIRIRVYRPENHTVRLIVNGVKIHEEYPFVILWTDRKVESE